jgi:FixJ family two-component response regulator
LQKVPVISIVDDDESVREATQCLVRSLGYVTATFASADEFLDSERLHDSSCLITDVQMPGINGLELHRCLIERGCRIPVIFITAFPEEKTRSRALAAGACGFLKKPFDDQSLIDCLERALKKCAPADRRP